METIMALGADHAGYGYKQRLAAHLAEKGIRVSDFGTQSEDSVDYPDFAHPVAEAVASGACRQGLLVCGSANGVAMAANKHAGIRAAVCWNTEVASLARQHNNANILCIPARFVSPDEALAILDAFLAAGFEGGRHLRRVDKIGSR